jgi:hypothetical protein
MAGPCLVKQADMIAGPVLITAPDDDPGSLVGKRALI